MVVESDNTEPAVWETGNIYLVKKPNFFIKARLTIEPGAMFYNNVQPMATSTNFNVEDTDILHNPDDVSKQNTRNGIFVNPVDEIDAGIFWEETEVSFAGK